MSRLIESQMEATAIFNEKYEQYKAIPGMTDAKAKHAASEAASFTYKANWAMLITDIPQYMFEDILSPAITLLPLIVPSFSGMWI